MRNTKHSGRSDQEMMSKFTADGDTLTEHAKNEKVWLTVSKLYAPYTVLNESECKGASGHNVFKDFKQTTLQLNEMTNEAICPKCKMSKYSKSTGSMTEWIATCRCDIVAPILSDQAKTVNLCTKCGKRINQGRVGSFTQFIFRFDLCACDKPSWLTASEVSDQLDSLVEATQAEGLEVDASLEFEPDLFPIERYKPLKVIGAGAGGAVYLCEDLLLNKLVAVKTLHTLVGEQLVAFQNEAKILSRLDHPNIVRILDFGITKGGAPYMVLEHSSGSSLEDTIKTNGVLAAESVRQICIALGNALSYCHERGVLHRDLKPSNIIFTKVPGQSPTIQLIDFGIAIAGHQRKTHFDGRDLVGTPAYMPPDQMLGLNYDARSEVYSLGCVMFEAMTGRLVFSGDTALEILRKHATQEPPTLSDCTDNPIPDHIQKIVTICLSKEPSNRYQTMQEFLEALLTTTNTGTTAALPSTEVTAEPTQPAPANVRMTLNTNGLIRLGIITCAIVGGVLSLPVIWAPRQNSLTEKTMIQASPSSKVKAKKTYTITYSGDYVEISGENITREAFIELSKNLKMSSSILFENEPQKVDWSGLEEWVSAPIHSLRVPDTTFGDNQCEMVARFPQLIKLDARATKITNAGVEKLSHSNTLTHCVLSSTKVGLSFLVRQTFSPFFFGA